MGNSNSGGHNQLPKHLKIVRGTYRPGREKESLPGQPLKILPPPPKNFNKYAKEVWQQSGSALVEAQILTMLDLSMFECYCHTKGAENEVREKLATEGLMVKGKVNPYDRILKQYSRLAFQIGSQFGLTPGSRTRIHPSNKPLNDPFNDV